MPRATKIVATLGPASTEPDVLAKLVNAGVDVFRFNFSHGTAADHMLRADRVRTAARNAGREVAIMADLQGPKIRIGKFVDGKIDLQPDAPFVLDAAFEGSATSTASASTTRNCRATCGRTTCCCSTTA